MAVEELPGWRRLGLAVGSAWTEGARSRLAGGVAPRRWAGVAGGGDLRRWRAGRREGCTGVEGEAGLAAGSGWPEECAVAGRAGGRRRRSAAARGGRVWSSCARGGGGENAREMRAHARGPENITCSFSTPTAMPSA